MNFVVVGAGALGTIYAAYLSRAGHEVSLIARGERAEALNQHGIVIAGQNNFSVRCNIVTEPQTLTQTDVVIVAVKTYDTEAALAQLAGLQTNCAFSIQNGVLKNRQLARIFGDDATLGAVGMLGGEVLPGENDRPGIVKYNMAGATVVGETDGTSSRRVNELVDALQGAGLNANTSNEITSIEWSKFVGWSGVSALAVLTRLPTQQFLRDADTALLAARLMRETAEVATGHGIALQASGFSGPDLTQASESDAVKALQRNGERMRTSAPDFRQSILQDADRGRRLEVNETLAHTLQLAQELGIETPTLDFCCRVLRVISRAAEH
jgi:2-dehydropantoate 2-reductase